MKLITINKTSMKYILNEINNHLLMKHPHIAPLYDVFTFEWGDKKVAALIIEKYSYDLNEFISPSQ